MTFVLFVIEIPYCSQIVRTTNSMQFFVNFTNNFNWFLLLFYTFAQNFKMNEPNVRIDSVGNLVCLRLVRPVHRWKRRHTHSSCNCVKNLLACLHFIWFYHVFLLHTKNDFAVKIFNGIKCTKRGVDLLTYVQMRIKKFVAKIVQFHKQRAEQSIYYLDYI